jgi:hypothetical protein
MESLSLSLFLFLPAPLKIVIIVVGFVSFGTMKVRNEQAMDNAQNRVEARGIEKVPVPPLAAPKAIKAAKP